MRISAVYVRFFRAFNYEYLRKLHETAVPDPWDDHEGMFYPYVRVDIAPEITCVVGANESGKSQLLKAIEFALGAKVADADDFCRYSEFFTVDSALRVPQFGLKLDIDPPDREPLAEITGTNIGDRVHHVHLFRDQPEVVRIFVGDSEVAVEVSPDNERLEGLLPKKFSIDPRKPVPESVSLDFLIACANGTAEDVEDPGRRNRWAILDPMVGNFSAIRAAVDAPKPDPSTLKQLLPEPPPKATAKERTQWQLAYDLLVTVGGIEKSTFARLKVALREDKDGLASGLVASMNKQLSAALNLQRWWTQDEQFELVVDANDHDLVFTIKDRTASEYTFDERSDGLKYFLSYLVQYLRHVRADDQASLLLMDEPDAYLSNQAQRDLLRLFQDFVDRDVEMHRQVVFVTHSPFLIDRNRADRVRVLDKGAHDEGTRVVRDVSRNHYEPLRSAFGGFAAEAAFIGNCNLVVEGASDQVYLAGISSDAVKRGASSSEHIDLNATTIVNAGSASEVPYSVFLARGRSAADQPAVVVLLDGDKAGQDAAKSIQSSYTGKPLLDSRYVLSISEESLPGVECKRPEGPREIEDLVTTPVLLRACERFAKELGLEDEPLPTAKEVETHLAAKTGPIAALQTALKNAGSSVRPDKVPIARHVVEVVLGADDEEVERVRGNFRHLFLKLSDLQELAVTERSQRNVGDRVNREIRRFVTDHADRATRSELKQFLAKTEGLLDTTDEAEAIRAQIRMLRNQLTLNADLDLALEVGNYEKVKRRLEALRYAGTIASEEPDPGSPT